jgi:hypothetical protein
MSSIVGNQIDVHIRVYEARSVGLSNSKFTRAAAWSWRGRSGGGSGKKKKRVDLAGLLLLPLARRNCPT